ncbi:MAG: DUF547 domain-containing protein [Desulfococcaceae bacterium]|nr:DUF547 domain-containing protein [Desulfococcaceae bacterium]
MLKKFFLSMLFFCFSVFPLYAFDHSHGIWDGLLKKYVKITAGGNASQADYAGFRKDQALLEKYQQELSAVSLPEFEKWTKDRQLAFLINAYNAFTIALILTKYPDIRSIKDTGSLFRSPWKKQFFRLLGEKRHLDWVEHEMIREPGVYDDPRIHTAVNCASVGCPALRSEAFVPEKLDTQLEDSMRNFLKDSSRNRYRKGNLEVSKVFDWYREDFQKGYKGIHSLRAFFARYAHLLSTVPAEQEQIRQQKADIIFLDYDWSLNDVKSE